MMVIDINVTSTCNLACTYCSEGFECGLSTEFEENTSITLDDITNYMAKIKDPHKDIYFWGGEPFVNFDWCKGVMNRFAHDKNINFFFYTNGVYLKKYMAELLDFQERLGKDRLKFQISYDGKAVNDITRPDKKGNSSTELIKANYLAAKEAGLNVNIKSVITANNFKYIYEAFRDVIEMDANYFPTPDLYSTLNEFELQICLNELKVGLQKIAKYIYKNNLPPERFGWFMQSRALCSSGINYTSIDLNGDISPCHGCMYKDSDDHVMGNINDPTLDFDKVIEEYSAMYRDALVEPLDCQNCDAQFCMKCNAASYEKSEKETYIEKWADHRANWQVCKVFKQNEVIHHALRTAMQGNGGIPVSTVPIEVPVF